MSRGYNVQIGDLGAVAPMARTDMVRAAIRVTAAPNFTTTQRMMVESGPPGCGPEPAFTMIAGPMGPRPSYANPAAAEAWKACVAKQQIAEEIRKYVDPIRAGRGGGADGCGERPAGLTLYGETISAFNAAQSACRALKAPPVVAAAPPPGAPPYDANLYQHASPPAARPPVQTLVQTSSTAAPPSTYVPPVSVEPGPSGPPGELVQAVRPDDNAGEMSTGVKVGIGVAAGLGLLGLLYVAVR